MEQEPIDDQRLRTIALEEGFKAFSSLDKLRLAMLNEAVNWIMEITGLDRTEVRKEIAHSKGLRVAKALNTIKASQEVIDQKVPPNKLTNP